jgi:hypothetical protein
MTLDCSIMSDSKDYRSDNEDHGSDNENRKSDKNYCSDSENYSSNERDGGYVGDDWPQMPDGSNYDDKELLSLVRSGNSPFHGLWDVNLLNQEIEENLGAQVIGISTICSGANNYVSSCLQFL